MIHVTCRLTAKNRDQLRNPMLGNRVCATFLPYCLGAWPEHHCKVADGALINETIPLKEDGSYDSCHVYVDNDGNETAKCDEWEYIYGNVGPTIVSKVI